MRNLGIVIGDTGVDMKGMNNLIDMILKSVDNINLSIFSDQVIGNSPCSKFCFAEVISFKGELLVFTVNDALNILKMHPNQKPLFLFDRQNRGNMISFMKLLDNIKLTIIQEEAKDHLALECFRLTSITPEPIIQVLNTKRR
jgi:hypothetical protein